MQFIMSGSILFLPPYTWGEKNHLVWAGIEPKSSWFTSDRSNHLAIKTYYNEFSLEDKFMHIWYFYAGASPVVSARPSACPAVSGSRPRPIRRGNPASRRRPTSDECTGLRRRTGSPRSRPSPSPRRDPCSPLTRGSGNKLSCRTCRRRRRSPSPGRWDPGEVGSRRWGKRDSNSHPLKKCSAGRHSCLSGFKQMQNLVNQAAGAVSEAVANSLCTGTG